MFYSTDLTFSFSSQVTGESLRCRYGTTGALLYYWYWGRF